MKQDFKDLKISSLGEIQNDREKHKGMASLTDDASFIYLVWF